MFKRVLTRALDATGALDALLAVGPRLARTWLPVLTYHRVHPQPEEQPFDRGVIDATPLELERQMTLLRRHFDPITVTDLIAHLDTGAPLPRRPALVSFDDGYKECVTRALPILQATGVRATFFVATGYIGGRRPFWWDRIAFILRRARRARFTLEYPEPMEISTRPDPERDIRRLSSLVKDTFALDVERFLDELASRAGVGESPECDGRDVLMSWDDVRALRDAGMDVQSHTREHHVLSTLRAADLERELRGSRDDLARELGSPPLGISYPVGRPIGDRPELVEAVRTAGYRVGFSTGSSWRDARVNPLDLGRTMLDRGLSDSEFRALLAHPVFA